MVANSQEHAKMNGSSSQATGMSWDPAALLNPRAAATSASRPQAATTVGNMATNTSHSASVIPDNPTFQFSTPTNGYASDFSGLLYNVAQPQNQMIPVFQNGFAPQIERLNNVQERIAVPQPKRRKTQNENDPQPTNSLFVGGNTGILSDYAKQQQAQNQHYISASKPRETVVDLTEGDTETSSPQIPRDPVKDEEVCFGMVEGAMINCHRVPTPKPGTMAIGGDGYWPITKVVLRRRIGEQNNTIYVYDCTRQIFGTVDPRTSACLAKLLDQPNLQIRTDCRITSRRKEPGEQAGQSISKVYKFDLMIYGPRKWASAIGRRFVERGMNLLTPIRVDSGVKVVNPLANENRPQAPPHHTSLVHGASYPPHPPMVRTVEEIRSEVLGVFDSLPRSEDLPEADPSDLITTPLLKHQRQALHFMTLREQDVIPEANDKVVTSTWRCKKDQHGASVYHNIVTNQSQRERPPPALGGILADMMGLGKTLSVLSLLTATLNDAKDWSRLDPVQPRAPEKKQSNKSRDFELPRAQDVGLTSLSLNSKATLLICPLSTVTNWEEQIKQHVKPGSLTYHIYHGPNRVKNVEELARFDLVITTYGSVSSELNSRVKRKRGTYPLEEIGWFRIALDEAHMIREQNTLAFKSVCRLQASRRWAVTGTPVQNKLEDLASLLAFLRLKPFDEKTKFVQYIITPFKNADPEIVPKLRVLIDTVTLRRLKDRINLPKRTDHIIRLRFDEKEQQVYDWFAKSTQERVRVLTGQGQGQDRIAGKAMIHILRSILQLRLICAHGKDLLNEEDLAELQGMTIDTPIDLSDDDDDNNKPVLSEAKAYEWLYLMQEANNDTCFRCNAKLGANEVMEAEAERQEDILGYMSPAQCVHVYCPACISSLFRQNSNARCNDCCNFPRTSFVELHRSRAMHEHESRSAKGNKVTTNKVTTSNSREDDSYCPHTKTRALIEDLKASKRLSMENPTEPPYKSVVFSGWTSHLDLIQTALEREGITWTRLDGKMSRPARNAAMDAFRDDPNVQVILVSIMAGGLGLNLTTANSVFVMEPQFNPAAEAQAVDRVHRLGQKREVRTVRYIMEGSFEESMLKLQEKKQKLANLSLDGRDKDKIMDRTEAARQRLMDLRSLFK
ncbi:SNF2 family N-terminal domain-containing protein [Lasiosphaeris hirsuta]|uniref:SNF2 family N-terminal domain-containing protein n=1 Tax=Lasiosphaeris hirsuta TaxID=260670 RepID=A0AA40AFI9_9PEZI|nr:SNF2 family N-terminal domain-containing protein [Lasiosphaeris hirsuta]